MIKINDENLHICINKKEKPSDCFVLNFRRPLLPLLINEMGCLLVANTEQREKDFGR